MVHREEQKMIAFPDDGGGLSVDFRDKHAGDKLLHSEPAEGDDVLGFNDFYLAIQKSFTSGDFGRERVAVIWWTVFENIADPDIATFQTNLGQGFVQ